MVALVPIVVFGVLLAAVTVPYVSLGPGPAFDTLGERFDRVGQQRCNSLGAQR